jgi:Xaa-Pro aminopeptidase
MPIIADRVRALRGLLRRSRLAAWIVPSGDPHASEYVPDRYQGRRWISGFDGSAGTAVIAAKEAAVWTDSRYWLAAGKALKGTPFQLQKQGLPGTPAIEAWLRDRLRKGDAVGLCDATVPLARFRALEAELARGGVKLAGRDDLLDGLWTDRPALPAAPFRVMADRWAGESRASKLKRVREAVPTRLLVADLSEVAWLLNVRGADVPTSPIGAGYVLLGKSDATLFADSAKVPSDVRRALAADGVEVRPYGDVTRALRSLPAGEAVRIDPEVVSARLARACRRPVEGPCPVTKLKAVKNRIEIRGFRDALKRDGVALVRFLAWLDGAVRRGRVTEVSASERLHAFRAEQPRFLHDSFEAIVAYQGNAALPHYRPGAKEVVLRPRGVLLVDSGGTYLDGTTDTTRVHALGPVPDLVRRNCTLVLKGVISLTLTRFPKGTTGVQLDAFARRALWDAGLDFGHGTGHGVGHCLNVHEGPNGFRTRGAMPPMEPGMVTTIEPGFYEAGRYGIRIENMVLGVEQKGGFQAFETMTLAPVCPDLLEPSLLTPAEAGWLDAYHAEVLSALSPGLDAYERRWLARQTRPLSGRG